MQKIILAVLLVVAAVSVAIAQQIFPPYVYPAVIGTSPGQVLPQNTARKRLVFFNPNPVAIIAFCPAFRRDISGPNNTSAPLVCSVNGAGSITLFPRGSFVVDGGTPSGPPLSMGSAWNGVSDTPSSNFTALEFE